MSDPLGAGVAQGAVTDLGGLATGSYVPVLVGAIVLSTGIGVGLAWMRRGLKTFKRPG